MSMILENRFKQILQDLNKHKRNRNDLIVYYINNRLNKSLITYNKELEDNSHILENNDNIFLLKRL